MIYDLYLVSADAIGAIKDDGGWLTACIGLLLVLALFAVRVLIAVRDRAE